MPNLGMLHWKKNKHHWPKTYLFYASVKHKLDCFIAGSRCLAKTHTHTAIHFYEAITRSIAWCTNTVPDWQTLRQVNCHYRSAFVCGCVCTVRTGMVPDLPRGQCFCAFVLCLSHRLESIWRMTLHAVTFHIRFFASVAAWSFRPLRQTINRSRHLCRGKYCVDKQCPHETSGHVWGDTRIDLAHRVPSFGVCLFSFVLPILPVMSRCWLSICGN